MYFFIEFLLILQPYISRPPALSCSQFSEIPHVLSVQDFTPYWSFCLGYSLLSFIPSFSFQDIFSQKHSIVLQVWARCLLCVFSKCPDCLMIFIDHQWLDTCLHPPLNYKLHEDIHETLMNWSAKFGPKTFLLTRTGNQKEQQTGKEFSFLLSPSKTFQYYLPNICLQEHKPNHQHHSNGQLSSNDQRFFQWS